MRDPITLRKQRSSQSISDISSLSSSVGGGDVDDDDDDDDDAEGDASSPPMPPTPFTCDDEDVDEKFGVEGDAVVDDDGTFVSFSFP